MEVISPVQTLPGPDRKRHAQNVPRWRTAPRRPSSPRATPPNSTRRAHVEIDRTRARRAGRQPLRCGQRSSVSAVEGIGTGTGSVISPSWLAACRSMMSELPT